jgi:hypothetical protein
MSIKHITTMKCGCERCGHTWITRTEEVPKVCSRCKRKDWNDDNDGLIKPVVEKEIEQVKSEDLELANAGMESYAESLRMADEWDEEVFVEPKREIVDFDDA